MIEIKNLKKSFGDNEILKGIDLRVEKGQSVALIGPSGSGKTTFLRCINFLEEADSGILTIGDDTVEFDKVTNKEIVEFRKKTSMVFQQYNLFANLTALENITEGLITARKWDKNEADDLGRELLDQVGLKGYEGYYPSQLSGGQQQRVGIARALALNPEVILFDEPTSALDPELVNDILELIKKLAIEGITMIIVTHEIGFAYDVADKIVFMEEGYVVEEGTPEQVLKYPKEIRTKQFLENTISNSRNLIITD